MCATMKSGDGWPRESLWLNLNCRMGISWFSCVTCKRYTVYPKLYAHGFCFAVLCCAYTLTDFPISIRLTSLALWQSNDCPSASKATLMNMDKFIHAVAMMTSWKHFPRHCPVMRGIHWSPVDFPHRTRAVGLWCFLWSALDRWLF